MGQEVIIDPQIEQLIARVSGKPIAMLMLARTLLIPRGMSLKACDICDAAIKLAPNDGEVLALARMLRSRAVDKWYFTMVKDHSRHARYRGALRDVLTPECTVLDIGAGTGLFAMLAAQEGAGRVFACERDAVVAKTANEIVRINGYSEKVTLIAKDSRYLKLGVDLDGPVDVLIWDNLSNNLLGAGALDAIEDARLRLLKPGARIIPGRCEMRIALVESNPVSNFQMGVIEGFDLEPFNRFRPTQVTLSEGQFERRSDSATIFDFDFTVDNVIKPRKSHSHVTSTGGRVDGILQWLRFHLTDDIYYDTGDDEGVTAFGMQYHAVEPFTAEPGQRIELAGAHDRSGTWFWIGDGCGN